MSLPQFHAELQLFARPGTLVDVGVNIGYHFSHLMSVPNSRLVGYEPQRFLFLNLCQSLSNSFSQNNPSNVPAIVQWPDNIELHNVALSNFVGRISMRIPIVNGTLCHEVGSIIKPFDAKHTLDGKEIKLLTQWVQVTTLDSQKLENVTFVKIDAEGAEQEIIEGAAETLAAWKPVIDIELEDVHRAGCVDFVTQQLARHGYVGYFIYDNELKNMDSFDAAKHQVCENSGYGATHRKEPYVFDFLFVHRDDAWGHDTLKKIYGTVP